MASHPATATFAGMSETGREGGGTGPVIAEKRELAVSREPLVGPFELRLQIPKARVSSTLAERHAFSGRPPGQSPIAIGAYRMAIVEREIVQVSALTGWPRYWGAASQMAAHAGFSATNSWNCTRTCGSSSRQFALMGKLLPAPGSPSAVPQQEQKQRSYL